MPALQWSEEEWNRIFRGTNSPVAHHLDHLGAIVQQGAKRRCPVYVRPSWMPAGWPRGPQLPSGYVRSKITREIGEDSESVYCDVISPAQTLDGAPLGLFLEVGTRAHTISAKNAPRLVFPWVEAVPGYVFATQTVHHPGTEAQPYLRPAVDDIRGGL